MDPLFPALPEDLSALDREALNALEAEHVAGLQLVRDQDAEFLGDLNATQIVAETRIGKQQLDAIRAAQAELTASEETFLSEIDTLTADAVEPVEEPAAEAELAAEEEPEAEAVEEPEPVVEAVTAAANTAANTASNTAPAPVVMRRPVPVPSRERVAVIPEQENPHAVLLASASSDGIRIGDELTPISLARMLKNEARRLGRPNKSERGTEERYSLAAAAYRYPEDRILTGDIDANTAKIRSLKNEEGHSLVASGGFCAPFTNIYTIPQFATNARPVRDALPSFQADRGGINVPVPTTLETAEDAITIITAEEDALGGTFATKACLDLTCLEFVETAVTIISHCREYGNLNARAWPESITFENELTMAEHARTAETYLLNRIKAQSIEVTSPDVYSSTWDFIYAAARAVSGIRYRLRTGPNFRFRALFPEWVREMTVVDIAGTQFDRFVGLDKFSAIMRGVGVEPSFYLDSPNGTSQGFAAEVAGTEVDNFPDVVQWALFPEGAFIHVDGGVLELGMVRDSTLNSTNDFQFFGESFENVARIAPPQAALWITSTVCPSGEFPDLTTALSC